MSLKGRETPGGATRSVQDRGGHRSPNPERAMKLAGAVGRSSDRTTGRTAEHLAVVETTRRGWRTRCRRYAGRSAPGSSSTLRGSSRGWRHPRGTVAVQPKPLEGPRRTRLSNQFVPFVNEKVRLFLSSCLTSEAMLFLKEVLVHLTPCKNQILIRKWKKGTTILSEDILITF